LCWALSLLALMWASLLLHAVADTWAWQVICRLVCRQEGEEKRSGPGPAALADTRARRGLKPGQLDPQTADFAHRLRELAGRRSYLRNFWYAAGARPAPAGAALRCALGALTWRSTLCLARLLGGRPPMQRAAREALSWRRYLSVLKTLSHNPVLKSARARRHLGEGGRQARGRGGAGPEAGALPRPRRCRALPARCAPPHSLHPVVPPASVCGFRRPCAPPA